MRPGPRTALLRRCAASSGTLKSKHAYNPPRHLIPSHPANDTRSPEEIHKLASKTKKVVGAEEGEKAACHSDYVDPEEAKKVQKEQLVQLNTAPALGIANDDRLI